MSVLTKILTGLLSVVAVAATAGVVAAPRGGFGRNWAPVHPGDFPDPSVLHWNGVYYAFATQNFAAPGEGINIQESLSTNGVSWTPLGSDALPKGLSARGPSSATPGHPASPTTARATTSSCTTRRRRRPRATSASAIATVLSPPARPLRRPDVDTRGVPERRWTPAAPSTTADFGGSIDPDIFTDPTSGRSWLFWKSDGNNVGLGHTSHLVRAAQLEPAASGRTTPTSS